MMKYLIFAVLLLVLNAACSDSDDKNTLQVSSSHLNLIPGEEKGVAIVNGIAPYHIYCETDTIVSTRVSGDSLFIRGKKDGHIIVNITDANENRSWFSVTVDSKIYTYLVAEESCQVETQDAQVKAEISEDVMKDFPVTIKSRYRFDIPKKELTVWPDSTDQHMQKGTFEMKDEQIILRYGGHEYIYLFTFPHYQLKSEMIIDPSYIILYEDFTEKYKALYPQVTINKVQRGQHLVLIK